MNSATRGAGRKLIIPEIPLPITVLLALGLAMRLSIAWAPLEWLLRYVLADDSFYYFTIARNFVHGHGFSFDTLAETNGFHPLWMVLLLPVYSLIDDRTLAIHGTLTLSALIDAGSIIVFFKLLSEIGVTRFVIAVIVGLYALAPVVFSHAGPMNGLETAVNLFLIFAYVRQLRNVVAAEVIHRRAGFQLGIFGGFLLLARTDNIILVSTSLMLLPLVANSSWKRVLLSLPTAILTAIVIISPWVLWSFLRFGTIVQVSGVSVPFMLKQELLQLGWSTIDYTTQFVKNLAYTITFFPVHLVEARMLSFPVISIAFMLVALTVCLFYKYQSDIHLPRGVMARLHLVMLVSALLFVLVHTLRAVYMRGWYYLSLFPLLLVFGATVLHKILGDHPHRKAQLLTVFALVGLFAVSIPTLLDSRHGEIDKFRMAQAMNSLLPNGTRVGSGNAGVYGYFFDKGLVVDLDGLVNNSAYQSIRKVDLENYCKALGVTHMVDPVGAFDRMARYWNAGGTSPLRSMDILHLEPGRTSLDSIALGRLR